MPDPGDNYVSQTIAAKRRQQARRVWAIGLIVVFAWVTLILAAPIAKANGLIAFASPLYSFFSNICHQLSDRSFHIAHEPIAVCTRCFGVYFGLLAGFVVYPLWRPIDEVEPLARFWLFLSLIPISIDWSLTMFGIWENTQASRFITGLILGVTCATFIVPALVEITRNLTHRRSAS